MAHCHAIRAVVVLTPLMLGACGTVGLFGEYDLPESPEVDATPYPRLVDVPAAPPPGTYTEAVPDPAEGVALLSDLGPVASGTTARAQTLTAPVVTREAVPRAVPPESLAGPVLTPQDRANLARARRQPPVQ